LARGGALLHVLLGDFSLPHICKSDFFTNKILATHGGISATEAIRVLAHEQAGMFNSLLPLSAMVATPLFGLLSDKIGKRAFLMMFGSILLMPVYLMMGFTNVFAVRAGRMMGVAFSPDSGGDVALGRIHRGPEQGWGPLTL